MGSDSQGSIWEGVLCGFPYAEQPEASGHIRIPSGGRFGDPGAAGSKEEYAAMEVTRDAGCTAGRVGNHI